MCQQKKNKSCWWWWLHNDDCDTIQRHLCFDIFLYAIALYQIAFHPEQQKNSDICYAVSSFINAHSVTLSSLYCVLYKKKFKSMKRVICRNLVSFPCTILHPASDSNSTASTTIDFKLATAFNVGCWKVLTEYIVAIGTPNTFIVLPKKLLTWINANVSILHWSGFCYLSFQSHSLWTELWQFSPIGFNILRGWKIK